MVHRLVFIKSRCGFVIRLNAACIHQVVHAVTTRSLKHVLKSHEVALDVTSRIFYANSEALALAAKFPTPGAVQPITAPSALHPLHARRINIATAFLEECAVIQMHP